MVAFDGGQNGKGFLLLTTSVALVTTGKGLIGPGFWSANSGM